MGISIQQPIFRRGVSLPWFLPSEPPSHEAARFYERGHAALGRRDFHSAIADFSEAIRVNPEFTDAYCCRGYVYAENGEHDEAIADYTEAIRLDPRDAKSYRNRGLAYDSRGETDKAIADYTHAIRLNPEVRHGVLQSWRSIQGEW